MELSLIRNTTNDTIGLHDVHEKGLNTLLHLCTDHMTSLPAMPT